MGKTLKLSTTSGAARTGSDGGIYTPPGAEGSVVRLPNGTLTLIAVTAPIPTGAVVVGGYPRPDKVVPTPENAIAPYKPVFNGSTPDPSFTLGEGQRQSALRTMLESARGGEATTGIDYGLGFSRYANDVTDPNDPTRITHYAGEVDQSSYTAPNAFTSGDTVGGFGNTDPNNPFSRASLLHRSYANANNVSSGSFANRGQLNSGAYQREQGRNTMGYEQGKDALLKGFAARMGEFQTQRNSARSTNDTSGLQNSNDLFQRNLSTYNTRYPSG